MLAAVDRLHAGTLLGALGASARAALVVERAGGPEHGDFTTNAALRLARDARRDARELAQAIIEALPPNPWIERAEVAGGGFVNFFLTADAYALELAKVHELGDQYGRGNLGA